MCCEDVFSSPCPLSLASRSWSMCKDKLCSMKPEQGTGRYYLFVWNQKGRAEVLQVAQFRAEVIQAKPHLDACGDRADASSMMAFILLSVVRPEGRAHHHRTGMQCSES